MGSQATHSSMQTLIDQVLATSWIEWLGTLTGILGVYLSIKEKIAAWPLFILCYTAYVTLSWEAGLLAALLMNLVFIALSIYGSAGHRLHRTRLVRGGICSCFHAGDRRPDSSSAARSDSAGR